MTRTHRTLSMIAVAAALIVSASFVEAGTLRAYIDGPLVIGDQVFSGGTLELVPRAHGNLVAIRLDGRQVALAFPETARSAGAQQVVLTKDARGFLHLTGYKVAENSSSKVFTVAAVEHGIATLGAVPAARGEGIAAAK